MPKHIHYEVTAEGRGTRIFEIVFEDDPFLTRLGPGSRPPCPGSFHSLRRGAPWGPGGIGRLEAGRRAAQAIESRP